MKRLNMNKKFIKLPFFVGLLLGFTLLFATFAQADPIAKFIEVNPPSLTNTGTVNVSINISNTSDEGETISVTLYDPAGNICSSFSSGGTAHLAPGASASYSGSWTVTQDQLDKGRIQYTARYSVTVDGVKVPTSLPIVASITHNTATANLDINRNISTKSAVSGQTVTITYTVTNTGTIDIYDLVISDKDISSEDIKLSTLKVGETQELTHAFTAGTASKTTSPKISYKYKTSDGKETTATKDNIEPTTIAVTIPDVVVQLTAPSLIVNPGDKVELTCVITNRSDLNYSQIRVQDATLGDIETNLSLGAGKTETIKKSITVSESNTYQFIVTGKDSSGNSLNAMSNELTIQIPGEGASDALNSEVIPVALNVVVEADREIIYSEPSDIVFHIQVTNNGADTVENVTVAAKGSLVSKTVDTIDKIEPGETVDIVRAFSASMGGKYVFTATAKNSQGTAETFESSPYQIIFQALSTPQPTPAPTAEPTPADDPAVQATDPNSPFGDTNTETGTGTVLLYILAILLVVILGAVFLLFVLDRRRSSAPKATNGGGGNVVIDSIQRSPHRDYSRAPKRGPASVKASPKDAGPAQQDRGAPDLTSSRPQNADNEDRADMERMQAPVRMEARRMPAEAAVDEEATPKLTSYDVEARKEMPNVKIEDKDSVFRRPDKVMAEKDETEPLTLEEPVYQTPEKETPRQDDGLTDNTEVYNRDYLSRIRHAAPEPEKAGKAESPEKKGSSLSEEDAALLSGSTGQYRLSRRSGSLRGEDKEPAIPIRAEDPEAFTRKQRAMRGKQSDLANFYEDDDPQDDPPQTRRRNK